MRIYIALIVFCLPIFGADTDVQVVTTIQTNAERSLVFTQDVFTRNGQTNLMRTTLNKAGVLEVRTQRFYHEGVLVAEIATRPSSFSIETTARIPYEVSFDFFSPSNQLWNIAVWTNNNVMVDAFTRSNGVFYPVESSVLDRATDVGRHINALPSSTHSTNSTPKAIIQ
jgi:hypothetical protein